MCECSGGHFYPPTHEPLDEEPPEIKAVIQPKTVIYEVERRILPVKDEFLTEKNFRKKLRERKSGTGQNTFTKRI